MVPTRAACPPVHWRCESPKNSRTALPSEREEPLQFVPFRWACRPVSSLNASNTANVCVSKRTANHAVVPGSAATRPCAPERKGKTSSSLPGLALSSANSEKRVIFCTPDSDTYKNSEKTAVFRARHSALRQSAEWSRTASARAGLMPRNRWSIAAGSSRFSAIILSLASPPRTTSNASARIPATIASATADAGSRPKPSSGPARLDFIIGVSVPPGYTVRT